MLGMRVKLYSKGSGRWEKSGGEAAKFGLTTTELLEVINRLEEADRVDMLKLLHFHIGSQLTDIKRIKNAMKEAARVYAKVYQMKVPIELLDVGGGMAVAGSTGTAGSAPQVVSNDEAQLDGGCGCRVPGDQTSKGRTAAAFALVGLLGAALARRRKGLPTWL